MTESDRLVLLRQDLQNPPAASEEYLHSRLKVAQDLLEKEGIQLDLESSILDNELVVMFAAWLYRARNKQDNPMPRMLRYAINNRLFGQKGGTDSAV